MWTRTTSSRDDWERLVAAVIKRDKIWQLCHQDSITTVDSDLRQRSLSPISVSPAPSPQLPLTRNSVVEGNYKSQAPLDWSIRPQIALGVARGLAHLHLECIRAVIHRDVTTSNILLDEDFQAVVAGFSLATFNDTDDGVVRGTNGYMAPECFTTGRSKTFKDDDDDMIFLSDCVTKIWEEMDSEGIVDPDIEGNFEKEEVEKLIEIALICMHTDPKKRPTMSEVVMMLENGHGFTESWEEYS